MDSSDTFKRVPAELTEKKQWVGWNLEDNRKLPKNCRSGGNASSTNSEHWTSFQHAQETATRRQWSGVGFVFTPDDPFCGIDLDDCRDPESGIIAPWAQEIIDDCQSYAEISPSGTGVKIFAKGRLSSPGRKFPVHSGGAIEIYDRGRYFTVTGWVVHEGGISDCQPVIDSLIEQYSPKHNLSVIHASHENSRNDKSERIRKYLDKCDPAISGNGGHNTAIRVACSVVQGFDITPDEAYPLLADWNQGCDPPWTEKELRHKLEDANKKSDPRGRGYLLRDNRDAANGDDMDATGSHEQPRNDTARKTRRRVEIAPYKSFPTQYLPDPVRSFVVDGAKAIRCDAAYIALPLLTAMGAVIGNTRRLHLKRSWNVPPILWTAFVGESGTSKTPAFKVALKPIHDRQEKAMQEYKAQKAQHSLAARVFDKEFAAWHRNKNAKPEEQPIPPEIPKPKRFICSDTTMEALCPVLENNPRGVLLARDELAGFFGGFDKYSGKGKVGSDESHWLAMHNCGALVVDRKTGVPPTIYIPQAAVSICGGIQPGILRRALGTEQRESGLAARFLFAFPPRIPKVWTEDDIDESLQAAIVRLFDRLFELEALRDEKNESIPDENNDFPADGNIEFLPDLNNESRPNENSKSRPGMVYLTDEAKEEWVNFYNSHNEEQNEVDSELAAAYSKIEEYAARLALIVHFIRWAAKDCTIEAEDQLDVLSMRAGIGLAKWFRKEADRVYSLFAENEDDREHRRLADWIAGKGGVVTARDVQTGCRWLRGEGLAEEALEGLVQANWGVWEFSPPGKSGGRPTRRFRLNPPMAVSETPTIPEENEGFANADSVDRLKTHSDEDEGGEV